MMASNDTAQSGQSDSYVDRLVKLIPSEVTTAYVAIAAALSAPTASPMTQRQLDNHLLYAFIVLFALVPLYLWFVKGVRNDWTRIVLTTLSFPIWAATVSAGVLCYHVPGLPPSVLSVVLILWTTILPVFVK
jgi:hypothetical protein